MQLSCDRYPLGSKLRASQIPYNKGITWPALLFGVIATIMVVLGLVPPYFELWKRDGRVIGISKSFRTLPYLRRLI
jgi:hypothetical protein